ncbi:two-component system response regulator [Devosia sp. Root413D1]|jgi:DNA-binding response OmpR family regulator|uniref:response regulator transcription factor n=1 Tax=unclassified Devosia TaxID=196773 RepID=UPI0006FB9243|nr:MULTISPECIES: response regulator transcription factor [unclassified Devosia]KQU92926.1 two-component system response regulator [Devosia sp. Root105]KQW75718.1 two-component system response regulator [Devosia sp. Root413D1]
MRILIAEDDQRIAQPLSMALTSAGFVVEIETDGEVAWYRGDTEEFETVILDLGLPTLDGLTILKRWRSADRNSPVLVLTARGRWEEKVEAIEAGADDYVVKPCRVEEVLARVRAIIRRSNGLASSRINFGDYVFDARQMQVSKDGVPIELTPLEFRLLSQLLHSRGRVLSQIELTDHLYSQDSDRDPNSIEQLVGRLRRRLGPGIIETRRGYGYVLPGDEG